MKIKDTSIIYRFANLMRNNDAPPMKDACEVFAMAGLLVCAVISVCILSVGLIFGLGFIGAASLAALGVAEPVSKTLAVLMAVATGAVPVMALAGLGYLCTMVKAEKLEGTSFYRFATSFSNKESESPETLLGVLGEMCFPLVIVVWTSTLAATLICLLGLATITILGINLSPEPLFVKFMTVLGYGVFVLLMGFAIFRGARWLCKRSTVEITSEI